MKKLSIFFTFCTALLALQAHAGITQPAFVSVDTDNSFAQGDMMSARWEKGDSFIGCGIRVFDDGMGGTFEFGFCQASDKDGNRASCFTQSKGMLDSLDTISDYSYISFSWNSETDECTRIGISTQSFYLNKDNPSFANKGSKVTP